MPYRCSIYGLGIAADKAIPGIPSSPISSVDVRITFGSLPSWLEQVSPTQVETSYIADQQDKAGKPVLRVLRVLEGKYFRFCYADQTEFVVDLLGTEVWARWPETLTLE